LAGSVKGGAAGHPRQFWSPPTGRASGKDGGRGTVMACSASRVRDNKIRGPTTEKSLRSDCNFLFGFLSLSIRGQLHRAPRALEGAETALAHAVVLLPFPFDLLLLSSDRQHAIGDLHVTFFPSGASSGTLLTSGTTADPIRGFVPCAAHGIRTVYVNAVEPDQFGKMEGDPKFNASQRISKFSFLSHDALLPITWLRS